MGIFATPATILPGTLTHTHTPCTSHSYCRSACPDWRKYGIKMVFIYSFHNSHNTARSKDEKKPHMHKVNAVDFTLYRNGKLLQCSDKSEQHNTMMVDPGKKLEEEKNVRNATNKASIQHMH